MSTSSSDSSDGMNGGSGGIDGREREARDTGSGLSRDVGGGNADATKGVSGDSKRGVSGHAKSEVGRDSVNGELRWYLIHCKPHQDDRALENLERQGFHCYRPARAVERCRDGVRYTATEPLFPGYLFIHLDRVNDNWYPIRSTRGVNQIVRFNQYPLPVRDEIVEGIRVRLAGPVEPQPYLLPGERVRITEGAFAQLEAIFVANDGNQRVVLLLNILQSEQRLSFPVHSVRKAVGR